MRYIAKIFWILYIFSYAVRSSNARFYSNFSNDPEPTFYRHSPTKTPKLHAVISETP